MNIVLIGGYTSDAEENPALQEFDTYMRNTLGDDADVHATYLDQLVFTIGPGTYEILDGRHQTDLREYDVVYIRGPKMRLRSEAAYYVSRYCAFNQKACINDYSLYYPGTKVAQSIKFLETGAPFLTTVYSLDKQLLAEAAVRTFGFPFVLKTSVGSHGDSNYLIHSQEQLDRALTEEPETKFLAQAFCPNDRDYRLLIMQDEYLVFERRGNGDSHINNTSKGGEAQHTQDALPREIINLAQQISRELGLMISGVDVMPNKETGEFVFLEINSQPQLRTGALLGEKRELVRRLIDGLA